MSADWQVGDLAVCVDDGRCRSCGQQTFELRRTYEVCGVNLSGILWLCFDVPNCCAGDWWMAVDFRKIVPDEHEACEPEFVTLLKRTKRTVRA